MVLRNSVFYSALRRHINKHGVQHPESVPIYINIADMMVDKGNYAQACENYGFAWMILEATKNEQYDRQKRILTEEVEKCLKEMSYSGTLAEWKNGLLRRNYCRSLKSILLKITRKSKSVHGIIMWYTEFSESFTIVCLFHPHGYGLNEPM